MIAPARSTNCLAGARIISPKVLSGCLIVLAIQCLASAATAQTTARIAIQSDYRLRGYSLSDGNPVAIADVGHEFGGGFYANAAGILVYDDGPALLGGQANIGYARRLSPRLSLDLGIVRSEYTSELTGYYAAGYTEFYAGLATDNLAARVSYSPDYFRPDTSTLYGEAEAVIRPEEGWRINLHAGILHYLDGRPYSMAEATYVDWRVGATRQLAGFDLFFNLSGREPGGRLYGRPCCSGPALVVGISRPF